MFRRLQSKLDLLKLKQGHHIMHLQRFGKTNLMIFDQTFGP